MRKSIFAKYFGLCAAITIICLMVLSILLTVFSTSYFKEDKYELLATNARKAASYTATELEHSRGNMISGARIDSFFGLLADAIDSNVFLTGLDGKVQYCTEQMPCAHTTYTVPSSILERVATNGEYRETGDFDGVYNVQSYSVGVPVVLSNGETMGYVFASMPAAQMSGFLSDLFRVFLLCEIAVLLMTSILVYFVTRQMTKPLREMAIAAKAIGEGDFSHKIRVRSADEVGELAEALNKMSQSLSMTENSRRSFVGNVSHELKTPMTSIGGFIDGILDGTIPPEQQTYYLKIVSDEVKRLTRLVRSMLDLSRIEAGETPLTYSQFNIVDTICSSVFAFESAIEKKNLDIKGLDHDKLMVEADADMIHQVVYNLTENAVKFANEGGYIEFDCKQEGGNILVSVKNSGAGLNKEELSHVFERFYKTDRSRGLDKTGVGLGLNIVQTILALHGGKITVRSVVGEYTEFVFSIPASRQTPKRLKK